MNKIVIEAGSTVTKIDLFDGLIINRIETATIEFKKNYRQKNELLESDAQLLISKVNYYKKKYHDVSVFGTSIFRSLTSEQSQVFLEKFKNETGIDFEIVSQEKEGELTLKGAVRNLGGKKAIVLVPGGGSCEIFVYKNKILEKANSLFGVVDILNKFPDLKNDFTSVNLYEVISNAGEHINLPKDRADIIIVAGGAHKYFAEMIDMQRCKNTFYNDVCAPFMMDIKHREADTKKFYEKDSLDSIRKRSDLEPSWWDYTRGMTALVLCVAKKLKVKYIIPTDISMVYGIV